MIEIIKKGFSRIVTLPEYGNQGVGISPYGGMDLFSMVTGLNTLAMDNTVTHEIFLMAPVIKFKEAVSFIITGAYKSPRITSGSRAFRVEQNTIVHARKDDVLRFEKRIKGYRTYISIAPGHSNRAGEKRKPFDEFTWYDKDGYIRVVEGPEYDKVENHEALFDTWTIDKHDDMGMRLNGNDIAQKTTSMVSGPVADGTIQLTPTGPIILLKNRQTVGGYPRILNVISADVDLLAQYQQGDRFKFKVVTISEARYINAIKTSEIISCIPL